MSALPDVLKLTAKFSVGEVVIFNRGTKPGIPVKVLEVIDYDGAPYYRVNRKDCFPESMLRPLTEAEKGVL